MVENSSQARKIIDEIWLVKGRGAMFYISLMDRHNIRGEQIVLAYRKAGSAKELCNLLDKADVGLIDYINANFHKEWARHR